MCVEFGAAGFLPPGGTRSEEQERYERDRELLTGLRPATGFSGPKRRALLPGVNEAMDDVGALDGHRMAVFRDEARVHLRPCIVARKPRAPRSR